MDTREQTRPGPRDIGTVVIGAGQAGLSTAYHLRRRGQEFVVLDSYDRVGDNWRCHWDSLRLYSPALAAALPGMPFPAKRTAYPTKDEMADFLESYRARFDLPVRGGVRVANVRAHEDRYLVTCTDGTSYTCDNVVVATGTFGRTPRVPTFAGDLDPSIRQLHSSDYKRPSQLLPGGVLVVGASHSGGDIAFEAGADGHPVVLSGPIHGQVPFRLEKPISKVAFPVLFFVARHVLTLRNPLGRKIRPEIRSHGGPLIRVKKADLARAGVEMAASRTIGVRDGRPVLADDRVLDVTNVVWCTGFRQDFSWIELPVTGDDGWPLERRGVVESAPGLYFVGLAFQFAFASMLVGGAGRDADHVVRHLVARTPKPAKGRKRGHERHPVSAA